jgi:oligopeptide transport system substrate-binding protein
VALGSWTADFSDPVNFLEVFKYKKGSTNNTGWENADYIDLLNRSSVCKAGEERNQLLRQAEEILMAEAPIIPIYHSALNFVKNGQFADVVLSPMGNLDLRWAYFKQKEETR